MKRGTYKKRVTHHLLINLLSIGTYLAVAGQPALAEGGSPASSGQTQTGTTTVPQSSEGPAAVPQGTSGMKGYIDPQTGRFRPDPAPGTAPLVPSPQERSSFSTSHEGLVEVPSSQPGGGTKMDLQGRFQSPLVGTFDADGKIKTQHLDGLPEPADRK